MNRIRTIFLLPVMFLAFIGSSLSANSDYAGYLYYGDKPLVKAGVTDQGSATTQLLRGGAAGNSRHYCFLHQNNDTANPIKERTNELDKMKQEDKILLNGYFEGNEPFWKIEIKNNKFVLHCINDVLKGTLHLSQKQAHTETYAFASEKVFGVLRKSKGNCTLDVNEEENPTHEIYFSYKSITYMGCGKMTVQNR